MRRLLRLALLALLLGPSSGRAACAGGYHGWPYWQRELHWALPQIMAVIGAHHAR